MPACEDNSPSVFGRGRSAWLSRLGRLAVALHGRNSASPVRRRLPRRRLSGNRDLAVFYRVALGGGAIGGGGVCGGGMGSLLLRAQR